MQITKIKKLFSKLGFVVILSSLTLSACSLQDNNNSETNGFHKIKLENSNLIYEKIANPKAKANVLLIHGYGTNFRTYESLQQNFSLQYSYYLLHLPSHGQNLNASHEEIGLNYFSKLLYAFITNLKLKNIILVGHSMGGALVSLLFNDYQLNSIISKVITIAPVNETSKNIQPFLMKTFLSSAFVKNHPGTEKIASDFFDPKIIESMNQGVQKIDKPFLLLYGTNDPIIDHKHIAQHYKKLNPQVQVAEILKGNHFLWNMPNVYQNVILPFLNNN